MAALFSYGLAVAIGLFFAGIVGIISNQLKHISQNRILQHVKGVSVVFVMQSLLLILAAKKESC